MPQNKTKTIKHCQSFSQALPNANTVRRGAAGGDTAHCVAKLEQLCGVAAGFRCTAASTGRERGDN